MGTIAVHEFISLDGVYENPAWTFDFGFDPKMGETITATMERSSAIVLGRRTYEMFYPAWSTRTADDDPGAPFFNDTRKYVVSGTLDNAEWSNSEIVGPYDQAALQPPRSQAWPGSRPPPPPSGARSNGAPAATATCSACRCRPSDGRSSSPTPSSSATSSAPRRTCCTPAARARCARCSGATRCWRSTRTTTSASASCCCRPSTASA